MSHLVEHCGHCGRKGTLASIETVVIERQNVPASDDFGPVEDAEDQTIVEISKCSTCGQLTLVQFGWLSPFFDDPSDAADVTQLYPNQRNGSELPDRVARRYAEMLKQIHDPGLFAVQAGTVLEAVCRDRGYGPIHPNGNRQDLHARLGLLAKYGGLPKGLEKQAQLVREYRNIGGHDDDLEATKADVPLIRSFVDGILEFLYWGPKRLARGTAELQRRRASLEAS